MSDSTGRAPGESGKILRNAAAQGLGFAILFGIFMYVISNKHDNLMLTILVAVGVAIVATLVSFALQRYRRR